MKNLSLRMRLTLLSAFVMSSAAILLTVIFLFGANRIFVYDLQNEIVFNPENELLISQKYAGDTDMNTISISIKKAGNQLNLWVLAGLFPVLILGTGAAWLMAGRALRPVAELSNTIEEISGNDLSRRVEMKDSRDEIGRLAQSFNHMMDKVSASFDRQKRFSASAAHELKTPLSTILVNLEVLELDRDVPLDRLEKVLSIVKTNTERMIRLVDDLFRLTSEKGTDMCEEIRLDEIFTELSGELSQIIQEKHLNLSVGDTTDIKLLGNRVMVTRAIGNLIENAVKYNHENGSISVSARQEEKTVAIRISDTGIGIPEEDLPHIFEPFYRVDRSRSRTVGGAGLGLSLVKDIVEKHNGHIEVKSVLGEGTVFILSFGLGNYL